MAETVKQDIDWGGSAFPCEGGSDSQLYPDPGMSLRDYFAGQVLVGAGTWSPVGGPIYTEEGMKGRAEWAYKQADAMIAARKGDVS